MRGYANTGKPRRRPFGFAAFLALLLPFLATFAFYAWEQKVIQRPVHFPADATAAAAPSLAYGLEERRWLDRKYLRVSGWVFDTADTADWLKPTVLVVAPGGAGVEFRTNLRQRTAQGHAVLTDWERNRSGFEVRLKRRYLPAGHPLKIYLVVHRKDRRELIDTGMFLPATP